MGTAILRGAGRIGLLLPAYVCVASSLRAQSPVEAKPVRTADIDREIREFLQREITAHAVDIKALDPPPIRVVGALTTGEFSWGTFMRTLGDYSAFASTNTIAGHDVPQMIGRMAAIELSRGGKTWAQLYAATAAKRLQQRHASAFDLCVRQG